MSVISLSDDVAATFVWFMHRDCVVEALEESIGPFFRVPSALSLGRDMGEAILKAALLEASRSYAERG